jgi:hypothetical protein
MALQKNIQLTDNFGIQVEIPNAYIKVSNATCSKGASSYYVEIRTEANGRLVNKLMKEFTYDLDGENAIKQAYLNLKTIPDFNNAIDC